MSTQLLLPAAGMGQRLKAGIPKALVEINGIPLIALTLGRFNIAGLLNGAVIIIPPGCNGEFRDVLDIHFPGNSFKLIEGGSERQQSVANGLGAMDADTETVVIHDAARPFVTVESVEESIKAAQEFGASTVAIPSIDTILEVDEKAFLVGTPDRARLWACQTPQTFRLDVIRNAHNEASEQGFIGTDDASLVWRAGGKVKLVMGTPLNIKVTTPEDRQLAELIIRGDLT